MGILAVLAIIALLALGAWIALTIYFARRFNRAEPSRLQRFGNMIIAGFAAGIIVYGVSAAILMAVCSGMGQ